MASDHLFEHWEEIPRRLQAAPRLLLLLDFDGTLTPIMEHPTQAAIPPETSAVLRRLAADPALRLAVISGRAASDVREKVGITGIDYVGNHGRERIRPGSSKVEFDPQFREIVERACREFKQKLEPYEGFWVEDKGLTAALHYRQAPESRHEAIRRAVERVASRFASHLKVSEGKRVFDVAPADGKDKGVSVTELLAEYGGLPIYCGDDTTDEAAFRVLGDAGLTIHVGDLHRATEARYRLRDPGEVRRFLERLADLRQQAREQGNSVSR